MLIRMSGFFHIAAQASEYLGERTGYGAAWKLRLYPILIIAVDREFGVEFGPWPDDH